MLERAGCSVDGAWYGQQLAPAHGTDFLWIDLRGRRAGPPEGALAARWSIHRVDIPAALDEAIARYCPKFLCFDFDRPTQTGLDVLGDARTRHPLLPALMLTEFHSADLVLWALRARVWDYLVKPVTPEELSTRFQELLRAGRSALEVGTVGHPEPLAPSRAKKPPRTQPAADLVRREYAHPLRAAQAAQLCCMSLFHFCRAFKADHGQTFREFVINVRLGHAERLLLTTDRPIKDIALSVGFKDVSNFVRTFRQHVGLCPSALRAQRHGARTGSALEAVVAAEPIDQSRRRARRASPDAAPG